MWQKYIYTHKYEYQDRKNSNEYLIQNKQPSQCTATMPHPQKNMKHEWTLDFVLVICLFNDGYHSQQLQLHCH